MLVVKFKKSHSWIKIFDNFIVNLFLARKIVLLKSFEDYRIASSVLILSIIPNPETIKEGLISLH